MLLALTILFAFGFMGIKVVEYEHKWKHGLLPGERYRPQGLDDTPESSAETTAAAASKPASTTAASRPATSRAAGTFEERSRIAPAPRGPAGLADDAPDAKPRRPEVRNVHIFFGVYFLMTGLHGLHVLGGIVAIAWILLRARKGHFSSAYFTPVDLVGLYWHLVDMIWIFLFPLLYLIH